MQWSAEDVIQNVRHFVTIVKRATGTQKSPDSEKGASTKPGMCSICTVRIICKLMSPSSYCHYQDRVKFAAGTWHTNIRFIVFYCVSELRCYQYKCRSSGDKSMQNINQQIVVNPPSYPSHFGFCFSSCLSCVPVRLLKAWRS